VNNNKAQNTPKPPILLLLFFIFILVYYGIIVVFISLQAVIKIKNSKSKIGGFGVFWALLLFT
jgi:hypothetical protein